MRLTEEHIQQLMHAYKAGYDMCREDMGVLPPYISQSQAYVKYKRRTVERWIKEGLVDVIKDGDVNTKCRIRREQIELVAAESNRASFFTHHRTEEI